MRLTVICCLLATVVLSYCKKTDDESNANSGEQEYDEKIGALQLGELTFDVTAASLADANSSLPSGDAGVAAGSLAIGGKTSLALSNVANDKPEVGSHDHVLTSIASGPPETLSIWIKSITINYYSKEGETRPDNAGQDTLLFNRDEGIRLNIDKATVDLSELVSVALSQRTEAVDSASAGGPGGNSGAPGVNSGLNLMEDAIESSAEDVPAFYLKAGMYNRVMVKYRKGAKIKGCVSGKFYDYTSSDFDANWPNVEKYSNQQTYCTHPDGSVFDYQANHIETFMETTAREMDFQLGYPAEDWKSSPPSASDDYMVEYLVPEAFTIEAGEKLQLTMLLDLNRLLRFETGAKKAEEEASTIEPDPFFFDSTFNTASFVFVGKPGRVYGYDLKVFSCDKLDWNKSTGQCANNFWSIGAWMTLITAPDGTPIRHSIMPNDDATLTVVKGDSGPGSDASTWISDQEDGTVNIRYYLDGQWFGKILGFPAALDDFEVGDQVGSDALNFTIEDDWPKNQATGYVYIVRRL